jgi:hypothetical protein
VWRRLGFHGVGNFVGGGYARGEPGKRVTSARVRGSGATYSRRGRARVARGLLGYRVVPYPDSLTGWGPVRGVQASAAVGAERRLGVPVGGARQAALCDWLGWDGAHLAGSGGGVSGWYTKRVGRWGPRREGTDLEGRKEGRRHVGRGFRVAASAHQRQAVSVCVW